MGVSSATIIVGGNIINQTWSVAGSPYIVQGDITVPVGAFLTIQSGVAVQFTATDSQAAGTDTSRVEMTIKGTLTANGTAASPITFRAQTGTAAATWVGIIVDAAASSAALSHVQIQHAVTGVRNNSASTVLQLSSSTIDTCQSDGVLVASGSPTITFIASNGNGTGFRINSHNVHLGFCSARGNSQDGVNFTAASGVLTLFIDHGTFHANGANGIRVSAAAGGSATANIEASNVTGNIVRGIYRDTAAGSTVVNPTYNNVWSNGTNYVNTAGGTGSLSANPLYVSATNLELTSNSPSRFGDAGAGDIGALPYAATATSGLLGTLWTSTTWNVAGSPYNLVGDITIPAGRTLTIDPGVTVSAGTTDGMAAGLNTSRIEITAIGTLSAAGTAANRIVFTTPGAGAGSWNGIVFPATGSVSSSLAYANIDKAGNGVTLASTGSLSFHDLLVSNALGSGVQITDGSPTLDSVRTTTSGTGVSVTGKGTPTLTNLVSDLNLGDGVTISAQTGNVTAAIINATIDHNGGDGIEANATMPSFTATANLKNDLITSNTSRGVFRSLISGPVTINTTFSDVWNNPTNYSGAAAGAGCISANPNYSGPSDYHLNSGSVAIDAGTNSGAPVRDFDNMPRPVDGDGIGGAVTDMGAFELPAAATPGETPEVAGGPQPPLLVSTADGGAMLTLTWGATCGSGVTDYAVYEGVVGSWYSHVPKACSTGGLTAAGVAPGPGNRYYLVVPLTPSREGGYGHRSNGIPIPVGGSPCRANQDTAGCP